MIEIWKPVVGYEETYEVSNTGLIKNSINNKILRPSSSGSYLHVTLCGKKNRKEVLVHRIVALAFIDNPYHLKQVNHKDENKFNNAVENLEWCTAQYNATYGKCASSRNTRVMQIDDLGSIVKEWGSIKEAAESLGIKYQGISRCCRKIRKHCGGFVWEYAD